MNKICKKCQREFKKNGLKDFDSLYYFVKNYAWYKNYQKKIKNTNKWCTDGEKWFMEPVDFIPNYCKYKLEVILEKQ